MEKIFYSFVTRDGYQGNSPTYFDVQHFDWAKRVEDAYPVIRKELEDFLAGGKKLWPYFDKDIVTKKNGWKTIPFMAWGVKFRKNRKAAPEVSKLIDGIPGCVSASFNQLDGDTEIVPHFGDTNAIARCHLGVIIPGDLPELGFRVQNEERNWEEGKLLMFCDAHEHTAWNKTEKKDSYSCLISYVQNTLVSAGESVVKYWLLCFFRVWGKRCLSS